MRAVLWTGVLVLLPGIWFVAQGEALRWFVDGGPPDRVPEIAAWVRENFAPISVGGRTVYDLDPESP